MAEKKAVGHAYNVDFLNVIFAASSIFLFVSVIWMVWDDYDRQWKNYQRQFVQLETEVTQASLAKASGAINQNTIKQLTSEREAAAKGVEANEAKIAEINEKIEEVDIRLARATQAMQFAKATYDVDRYAYEVRLKKDPSIAETEGKVIDEQLNELNALNLETERLTAERAVLTTELATFTGAVAVAEKKIQDLTAERNRLAARIDTIAPGIVNTYLLNAPLLDFLAPTIKVRQVITPNVVDDVNFTRVAKMDRCMTCHLAIDKEGYEKYPQPFRTHPNLNTYVGGSSPHPMEQTGCTVCHEGMGQSISFTDVAHTPRSEQQKVEWEEKYHWEVPHLWDYPMLPTGMTEASCSKCHREEVYVPAAPELNLAYATYERAGCYACHKTKGFENLRKPGPNLTKVGSKLTADWVKNWIRNPRAVKASTWMPKVWYNSNSSSPADAKRNEAEIEATVAYLFANTSPHEFAVASPPRGDPAAGQRVVQSIGCLGCHVTGDETREAAGPRRTFGQPLQNIGNKTSYEWLFDWVRDPRHYSPETFMPDLRLTDQQAADVASYLVTLKGPAGDAAKAAVAQQDVDDALMDYLKSIMPVEEAKGIVAKTAPDARKIELGRRVIARYGCFSCHEIKGFETTQPIGIELSEEGSKLLTQLDFAHIEIPHTKIDWFTQKIHDPRSYDEGRVLQPLEKLRMPDYGVSEVENKRLVTAVMSMQRDVQPPAAWRPRNAKQDALSAGRDLTRRRNCVSCHVIEGDGGDYQQLVADPTLAPPLLTPEGAKVKPEWLYAFLRAPITIRPWLDVRMPTFHLDDPQLNTAIRYFENISDSVGPFRTHDEILTASMVSAGAGAQPGGAALRATGKELFDLLRCQQCHVLGAIPADQPAANLAPDLRMAPERLQPDWILAWLRAPARIQPGTRMPAFWPDHPKSPFPQLGGDAELQIRSIRDHLMTFRGGPSPMRPAQTSQQAAGGND